MEGENAFSALGNSWELTQGNRLLLFVLGLVFFLVSSFVWDVTGAVTGFHYLVDTIAVTAVASTVTVAWIAVASEAYNQLRGVSGSDEATTGTAETTGPTTL